MKLSLMDRQTANFPAVTDKFVIVKLAAATHASNTALLPAVRAAVAAAATAGSYPDPGAPRAIILANPHATATFYLWSRNSTVATTEGLPIPAGQSLFLGLQPSNDPQDELRYEAANAITVAAFF